MPRGRGRQVTPIDVLHDDVLLVISDFYVGISQGEEAWQSLVHVCRRWRYLVFGSPRRLNLRLVCTPERENLDIWPALPLIVRGIISLSSVDNIVDALGHSDRVCQIDLRIIQCSRWDKVLAAMQVEFPAMTHFELQCLGETTLIPETFLGGYVPRLRHLSVGRAPFSGIPNLLLSCTHLVDLDLHDIPSSGYISPKTMATCLSWLTSLRGLALEFRSSLPHPDRQSRRRPPPMTRSILPNLKWFGFKGAFQYLDDLVARIDAPRLYDLSITFLDEKNFDTPHLVQFISRTPTFDEPNEAHLGCNLNNRAAVRLRSSRLRVEILCKESEQHLTFIAEVCTKCLPLLSTVGNLRLGLFTKNSYSINMGYRWNPAQRLELLRPFTGVKNFYLSEEFQPNMASALQELVGGRTMEVLPSLQNIFLTRFELSGPFQEAIGRFLAARQLSGHPIAVLPCKYIVVR